MAAAERGAACDTAGTAGTAGAAGTAGTADAAMRVSVASAAASPPGALAAGSSTAPAPAASSSAPSSSSTSPATAPSSGSPSSALASAFASASPAQRRKMALRVMLQQFLRLFPPPTTTAGEAGKMEALKNHLKAAMVVKLSKTDAVPVAIARNVVLGGIGCVATRKALQAAGVTHILTVASSILPLFPDEFTYKVVPVTDAVSTNLKSHFQACINFIDTALADGGRVLVHCFAGKSRSVTVCTAYLMAKTRQPMVAVLKHIRSVRPVACPNAAFGLQLIKFQRELGIAETAGNTSRDALALIREGLDRQVEQKKANRAARLAAARQARTAAGSEAAEGAGVGVGTGARTPAAAAAAPDAAADAGARRSAAGAEDAAHCAGAAPSR